MNNKVIIVTGASRGIGREITRSLSLNNYTVIANYNRSFNEAKELQEELKSEDVFIDIFKADVSDRTQAKSLVDFCIKKYGRIDVLINNAGISSINLFTDITDDEWNKVINTNLYSCFCMSQEACKNMIHNKSGLIINISSVWGLVGSSCESLYSISKAGIDAMTKSLAKELGPSNIRVNSIAPGFINTDMNNVYSENDINIVKGETPLGKIGAPSDIAKCVKWLIEDEFTTGQVISINGGWIIT